MTLTDDQKKALYPGLISAFGAVGCIAIATFVGPLMPLFFYNLAQAISFTSEAYLVIVGYGIFNGLLAADRFANAFAMGIVTTWERHLSIIASIPFGISAFICNLLALPTLSIFVPAMMAGSLVIMIAADIYARIRKYRLMENKDRIKDELDWLQKGNYQQEYAYISQANMTDAKKIGRLSRIHRDNFGCVAMPIFGVLGLIAYTVLRALAVPLPVIALSIPFQIGVLALLFVSLTVGTLYLFNHNTERKLAGFINDIVDDGTPQSEEKDLNVDPVWRSHEETLMAVNMESDEEEHAEGKKGKFGGEKSMIFTKLISGKGLLGSQTASGKEKSRVREIENSKNDSNNVILNF